VIRNSGRAEALQVEFELKRLARMPIDGEKRQRPTCLVVNAGDVEIGNVVGDLGIITR
jgi:hypothetical protein